MNSPQTLCKNIKNREELWFFEKAVPNCNSDFKIGVKIKEKLYSQKSEFQNIEIYDTNRFGRMLVLDGIIQTSENDEFIYHETICHTPMFYHPKPKTVLIIGGGDGGALEEILKYPIEKAFMVEIDKKVTDACKTYIPSICKNAFNDPRTKVLFQDGYEFIKNHKNFFDVIILDLSDPEGPAENLITTKFYNDVKNALTENGIIAIQSGSFTYQPMEVTTINQRVKQVFPYVKVHKTVIPTYQSSEFSITIAAKFDLNSVKLETIEKRFEELNLKDLKYYTPQVHFASAVLPTYLQKIVTTK